MKPRENFNLKEGSVQKLSDNFIHKYDARTPVDTIWEEIKDQHN